MSKQKQALLFVAFVSVVSATLADMPRISSGGRTPGGVEVSSASILPENNPMAGTFLVRLRLRNTAAFEQDVTCIVPNAIDNKGTASSTMRLAPGGTAFATLPMPPVDLHFQVLRIRDSSGECYFNNDRPFNFYSGDNGSYHRYSSSFEDDSCAYLSKSVPYEAFQEAIKAKYEEAQKAQGGTSWGTFSTKFGSYKCARGGDLKCVKSSQVAAPWPTDWRAYLPYPLCIVADRDFPDIPEGAREALRRYVAAGGNLLLVGDRAECLKIRGELFADALASLTLQSPLKTPLTLHYGLGEARVLQVADITNLKSADLPGEAVGELADAIRDAKCVFHSAFLRNLETNPYFVIDISHRLHIPTGLFITVLLLFVILAGPVSMIVLARRNRRIWIIWVLPAISLVFTLVIIASMLMSEGVRPFSTRDAVTLLAQRDGRALTIGGVSVYAPFALARGLDFDRDSDIAPVVHTGGGSLDYGRTLHYGGGWVAPRSPALFGVRRFDILRERVEVFESEDGVEIVNALGAPISRLTLWNSEGRIFAAESVPSGARVRLFQTHEVPQKVMRRITGVYNSRYGKNLQEGYDWREPEKPSLGERGRPKFKSAYAAEIKGACPFLDDPLKGRKHHADDSALVFGSYEPKINISR